MDKIALQEQLFEENRKSVGLAYLLWFFFGGLGVHRFYTGNTKSALVRLALTISIIGFPIMLLLWLIDLFLIPGLVHDRNMKTINLINHGASEVPPQGLFNAEMAEPQPKRPLTEADRRREAMLDDLRQTGYRKDRKDTNPLYR